MDPKTLGKKSAQRAFTSTGNMVVGACSLFMSAAFANPLPFILFGLGSAGWVFRAVTSGRYTKEILQEEHEAQASRAEDKRHYLEQEIKTLFETTAIRHLVEEGQLPDYMKRYYVLNSMREQILSLTHARGEIGDDLGADMVKQVDFMLASFLRLIHSRLLYVQVILGVYIERDAAKGPKKPMPGFLQQFFVQEQDEDEERRDWQSGRRKRGAAARSAVSADERIAKLLEQCADLERRIGEEPSAAAVYRTHVSVIKKQIELLHSCVDRDKRVAAQLDTFVSAFQYILDRLRASQFEAGEVTSFMGSLVEQVDQTVQYAEAVRPGMDELFGDLSTVVALQ